MTLPSRLQPSFSFQRSTHDQRNDALLEKGKGHVSCAASCQRKSQLGLGNRGVLQQGLVYCITKCERSHYSANIIKSKIPLGLAARQFWGRAPPPGGEAPSVVNLVMSVRPCIHPKP